jgi:hypothetical protein
MSISRAGLIEPEPELASPLSIASAIAGDASHLPRGSNAVAAALDAKLAVGVEHNLYDVAVVESDAKLVAERLLGHRKVNLSAIGLCDLAA